MPTKWLKIKKIRNKNKRKNLKKDTWFAFREVVAPPTPSTTQKNTHTWQLVSFIFIYLFIYLFFIFYLKKKK